MRRSLGLFVVVAAIVASLPTAAARPPAGAGAGAVQPAGQAARGAGGTNAAAEKTIIANERAINAAVTKGDVATFRSLVTEDSWAIDPMSGRMATAEFIKTLPQMQKEMKVTSWDITESQVYWVEPTVAVHSYKWTGQGTYQGQPVPSPVWASTVWARRGGKWLAVFHHEAPAMPASK